MKKNILIILTLLILFTTGCSSKSKLNEITYEEYENLIENKKTFVLEMMSDSCSHCSELKPKLEEFIKEHNIDVKYINTNSLTDEERTKLKKQTGTLATPTIFFYVEGEELSTKTRIVGDVSKDKLIEKFKQNGYID